MRFLNVDDLRVYEFNDDKKRPPYAILSHTWGKEEVSFQSIHTPEATSMAGYAKILKCCEIAKQDGFEYVWIDTCCIDKTSSAELSEAINSMFMWYKSASVCYAFLADFSRMVLADWTDKHITELGYHLHDCRWFRRGWTLQELLAPETVVFYNSAWVDIGTKRSLRDAISTATKIPSEVLLDASLIQTHNVAERMSWAAERNTTRVEDRAYSLMGLFGVNMPLLYGEGNRAFRRLQLEIMKDSSDESIFLWSSVTGQKPPQNVTESDRVDMLAPSPPHSRKYNQVTLDVNHRLGQPFMMTNKGLHIWLQCKQISDVLHLAALNCTDRRSGRRVCIVIYLDPDTGDCARVTRDGYIVMDDWNTVAAPKELYIKQIFDTGGQSSMSALPNDSTPVFTTFMFTKNINPETGYHLEHISGGYVGKWRPDVKLDDLFWPMLSRSECTIFDMSSSRYCANPTGNHLGILYFVVKSIQEPDIQAFIMVAIISKVGSPRSYHYRVFRGSKIPPVIEQIAKSDSSEEWKSLFAKTFPERDGSLIHYNDGITKRLNDNCIIRMTIRKGPYDVARFTSDHQILYVYIAFGRTPIEGEAISDADIMEG